MENTVVSDADVNTSVTDKKQKTKHPINFRFFTVLLYIEAAALVVLLLAVFLPVLFGFQTFVVMSGSMSPTIPVGSLVYVDKNVSADDICAGDVIAFDIGQTEPCLHRVIEIDEQGRLITQGDANESPDMSPVDSSRLIGRETIHLPSAGYAISWAELNKAVIIIVVLATFALSCLEGALFGKRSKNNNEN